MLWPYFSEGCQPGVREMYFFMVGEAPNSSTALASRTAVVKVVPRSETDSGAHEAAVAMDGVSRVIQER